MNRSGFACKRLVKPGEDCARAHFSMRLSKRCGLENEDHRKVVWHVVEKRFVLGAFSETYGPGQSAG